MRVNLDEKYKKHFSKESFFRKIARSAAKAGLNVVYAALLLYYVMIDNNTSIKHKGIILMALGYFILPTDFLPDMVPALGFTDDLAALAVAFKTVQSSVTPEHRTMAKEKLKNWFKNIEDSDLEFIERQLSDY